ncbi:DUF418 domain-containing protein [Microlunatus speluncae]|uniref:DUF418 domain-containing protein n=1 Tax=Microlunatus speluncae TaxID=2594267 RepID=UPI0012660DBB|nr:DUF418 domain-containing protein [Microlunatus speluncae]
MPDTLARPGTARMLAPDLARGFMLLLIALAHAPLLITGPEPVTFDERLPPAASLADQLVNLGMTVFVFSRSYPLFAALLGYGLVLVIESRRRRGEPETEIRARVRSRGWWMLVFGLGMAILVTPVEILGAYGLITVLLAGVLIRDDRALRKMIMILAGVAVLASIALGFMLSAGPGEQDQMMAIGHLGYAPADLAFRVVSWLMSVIINTALFPVALAVLVGVWAGRRRLLEEPERNLILLRRIVTVGLPISIFGAVPLALSNAGMLTAGHGWWAQAVHVLSGLAGGFAYAAIFGLIGGRVPPTAHWTRPLTAIGQRSLTCYIVMEAALIFISSTAFLGFGARVGPAGAAVIAIVAWLVAAVLANILHRLDRPGPAEWLLRRLVNRPRGQRPRDHDEEPARRSGE